MPRETEKDIFQDNRAQRLPLEGTDADISTASWFNEVADQFNSGLSKPQFRINTFATHYVPSLIASTLAHAVQAERNEGNVGIFTRYERFLLSGWAENREREVNQESPRTKILQAAEFFAVERFLAEGIKGVVQKFRAVLPFIPENGAIDNAIAMFGAKEMVDLSHVNAVMFEKFVAINASAVDENGLYLTMHNTIDRVMQAQDTSRRNPLS